MKWLSAPERDTFWCSALTTISPLLCLITAPWWVMATPIMRRLISIDWLISTDSWTNWLSNRHGGVSTLTERSCRDPLFHIQQMRQKKIWQSDSISSFSPNLAALWAFNMCLQREFSKRGHHFEHRLCTTLTDLYGSSQRSLKQGCVVRLRRSLSSVLWYSFSYLPLSSSKYIPVWMLKSTWCFLKCSPETSLATYGTNSK